MRIKTLALLMLVPLFVSACTPAPATEDTNESPFSTESSSGDTNGSTDTEEEPMTDEEREEAVGRNEERIEDTEQVAEAVEQFVNNGGEVDNLGVVPHCKEGVTGIGTVKGLISLDDLVPEYLSEIPIDPSTGSAIDSGYALCRNTQGDIVISAPGAELGTDIKATK